MRSSNRRAIRTCLFSLIVLTFAVPSARAQGETFTATAALKGSGGCNGQHAHHGEHPPIHVRRRPGRDAGGAEEEHVPSPRVPW